MSAEWEAEELAAALDQKDADDAMWADRWAEWAPLTYCGDPDCDGHGRGES